MRWIVHKFLIVLDKLLLPQELLHTSPTSIFLREIEDAWIALHTSRQARFGGHAHWYDVDADHEFVHQAMVDANEEQRKY